MFRSVLPGGGAIALAILATAGPSNAETLSSPSSSPTELPAITVTGNARQGSATAATPEQERQEIGRTAGSVGFVDQESFRNRYAGTIREVLKDQPGVFVQTRYGKEMRLSVRGSGAARGYHLRGLELLQDGIPVNAADGSGDFYQIDPLALQSAQIFKGGNALSFGGTTLGGAINFSTPTARTALSPNSVRAEAGSFGTYRLNGYSSGILGDVDYLVGGTLTRSDGHRDHSRERAGQFNANLGYRVTPDIETRFYAGVYTVRQELPGSLSLSDALNRPTIASAGALSGDQARDSWTQRIANRTSIRLDTGQLDISGWAIHKKLFHPIFQVIDQDGWTYGLAPRYSASLDLGGFRNDVIVGGRVFAGRTQARQYVNLAGSRGTQTLNSRQSSANYEAYAENRFYVLPDLALMTGGKLYRSERDYTDKGGLAASPTRRSAETDYTGFNPKLGLLWEPATDVQLFADVTRSADVPDFSDLTQIFGAQSRFVPLDAQRAWTVEVGSRGRRDRFAWDVTAYRSWVRDELLQFVTDPSIPASTFNAGRTIHQGLELGASVELARGLAGPAADSLTLAQVWTLNDFRFSDDPRYGDNRIAGLPKHVLRTSLSYRHESGFYLAPAVDWVPVGAWADQANTLRVPGYTLLGLQAGLDLENGLSLFLDARNLTDKRYVGDIGTVTDARVASTQIFYPGEGRSLYAGARYSF